MSQEFEPKQQDNIAADVDEVMRKYDRDKYIFIIENAELDKLAAKKFSVLQEVRDIQNHEGVVATLSIGIGRETLAESYKYAGLAIDMALSRGGDQAVIKNRYSFEFFGGLSEEVEKRTKVKSRVVANALSQLIRDVFRRSWVVQIPCNIHNDLYHVLHSKRQILNVIQPSILQWRPSSPSEHPWRNNVRWTVLLHARQPAS